MKTKERIIKMMLVLMAMAMGTKAMAQEAYACYTASDSTLTFYYDNKRSSRSNTYDLNTGNNTPGWNKIARKVVEVSFDGFADARPTTTCAWFKDMEKLRTISFLFRLNTSLVTNMNSMFEDCSMKSLDLSDFDTSNVTSMKNMFSNCRNLKNLDISSFNTSNVTNMNSMFENCGALTTLDIRNFDTSNVTDMGDMFAYCYDLTTLDLRHFNTSKVTNMAEMFFFCISLQNIAVGSGWKTDTVNYSGDMFSYCESLVGGKGTTWKSSNPTDYTYAHIDGGTKNPGYFTDKLLEAYACYTSSNTTLTFYYDYERSSRTGTTYDLSMDGINPSWYDDRSTIDNVTKVVFHSSFADVRPKSTFNWFGFMTKLKSIEGMSYLNTSEVTDMAYMFQSCESLTAVDLSILNTSNVTDMEGLFSFCKALTTLDLRHFNTAKVTNMAYMFQGCTKLQTVYVAGGWKTNAVTGSTGMFSNCTSLVGGKGTTWKSSNPSDVTYAHIDGGTSRPGYLSSAMQGTISTNINEAYGQRESVKGQRNERYNLSGQRVGKDYKGIVIINGNKVVIK